MASAAGETKPLNLNLNMNLNGRVAIVTGASRGIGRVIAIHLHSLGARVVLNYASSSTQANQLASQLNTTSSSSNPTAIAVQADITDPDQVKLLFDKTLQAFGSDIHILVNSAGFLDTKYPPLSNTTLEDWDSTLNVNARAAFLLSQEASKRLVRGGGGRIIMITSSLIVALLPGFSAYAASKAAVETMTKILAKELKGTGITANCVAPGPVASELLFASMPEEAIINNFVNGCPLERLGKPEDVSGVVGFLASDAGEWINGQIIRANGGMVIS